MIPFKQRLIIILTIAFSFHIANAQIDTLFVFDTEQEHLRYKALLGELRCPKCQNQSLLGSDAGIAIDLRIKVYDLMNQGMTDEEIKDYLQQRYSDFVLYDPPVKLSTLFLWALPFLLMATIILILIRSFKNQRIHSNR